MKVITLIPTSRNDGSVVGKRELKGIIQQFYETFGGATVEGPLAGHWVDGDHAYHDQHMKVSVDCQNSQLDEARSLVLKIGRQLGQLAMYFEVQYYDGVQILKVED